MLNESAQPFVSSEIGVTDYSVGEADPNTEAAAIADIWSTNLSYDVESATAKLGLGYTGNLAGPGTVLLLKATGDPIPRGTLGLHPRRLYLGQRSVPAVALADFAVDREHRSLGPAMMLMRNAIRYGADRFEMTYGLPNPRASAIFAACKLKHVGNLQRYATSLRSYPFLSRRLPAATARLCAPVVDATFRLLEGMRSRGSTLTCCATAWTDSAFDLLWSRRPDGVLLSERTGAMLAWRFGSPGRADWQICACHDRDGGVCGYVVWRSTNGFVEVGDFFTAEPATMTAPLMMAFTRFIRRTTAHTISVEFFGPQRVVSQLTAAGLRRRPEEWPLFVGPRFLETFTSPSDWYVTAFDTDAD